MLAAFLVKDLLSNHESASVWILPCHNEEVYILVPDPARS